MRAVDLLEYPLLDGLMEPIEQLSQLEQIFGTRSKILNEHLPPSRQIADAVNLNVFALKREIAVRTVENYWNLQFVRYFDVELPKNPKHMIIAEQKQGPLVS